ncbi:MAG: radical SAM protein [Acetivibrio ethanolgignens]
MNVKINDKIRKMNIIENHIFSTENGYYLFAVSSMQAFEIDKDTFECISLLNSGEDFISTDYNEILEELVANEILIEKDEKKDNFGKVEEFVDFPIKSLALHLIHDCNLRCTYCYGEGGSYGGERKPMTDEVAYNAIDFLLSHSDDSPCVSITLFGGEPLLNMPLIKKIVCYCRKSEKETGKEISLGMTTNATLLDKETREYLNENNITVGISIDGPKDIHDSCRVNVNGAGSYDQMIRNTEELLKDRDGRVTARITLTRNCMQMDQIMQFIEKMGFRKVNIAFVSGEDDSTITIKKSDYEVIAKEYDKIASRMLSSLQKNEPFYNNLFYSQLRQLHDKTPMLYNCGAGRKYLAVDPEGNLFICHRFVGKEDYKVGTVFTEINKEKVREVAYAHVEHKEECKKCWARYLCAGGCFYNSYEKGGNLLAAPDTYCDLYKKQYEVAIELYNKIKGISPEFIEDFFAG